MSPGNRAPVGLDELRLDRRHRLDEARQQRGAGGALHAPAHPSVVDDQVDVVAGPGRDRREQQARLERRVEAGLVGDPGGRGAAGVDQDDDAPVALRSPGAHDEPDAAARGIASPRRRPPVERTHVVAAHVVAQAVELGALPAHHDAGEAVELAQAGQARRQVLAGGEGGQHADASRDRVSCAGGRPGAAVPTTRTVTCAARRSPRRVGVSIVVDDASFAGRDVDAPATRASPRRRAARRRAGCP